MARPWRVEYPGAMHHVTAHAVAGQDLFLVDGDRHKFISLLAEVHRRWGTVFHGYCLMSNHYHLEVETPDGALSRPIKWLNQTYASYLNWRMERRGHLFDGRFKSLVVDADTYLHELSRYIHLNPVRAGIVPHPADYRWSSYRAFIGLMGEPSWLATGLILDRFGRTEPHRRTAYRQFVEVPAEAIIDPLQEALYGAVLGTQQFADAIRAAFAPATATRDVSRHAQLRPRIDLETICAAVTADYGVPEQGLREKGRHRREARDVAIYLAARSCAHGLTDVGAYFGHVGGSAVCQTCRRVEKKLADDAQFRQRVEQLGSGLEDSSLAPDTPVGSIAGGEKRVPRT